MEKPNKKQIFSLLSFVLSVAIFALALYVFITSVSARSKNGQAEIFGYSFAIVATNSMAPEIKAGDLIIVKSCSIADIKEGDNAVFLGLSGTFKDKRVVHRVVGVYEGVNEIGDESIYLETWGISNPKHDDDYVYASNFIGREIFHSTLLGSIMSFLRVPTNWFYLIIIGGVIYFAVKQGKKIVGLVKAKYQEQTQEKAPEEQDEATQAQEQTELSEVQTDEVTQTQEKAPEEQDEATQAQEQAELSEVQTDEVTQTQEKAPVEQDEAAQAQEQAELSEIQTDEVTQTQEKALEEQTELAEENEPKGEPVQVESSHNEEKLEIQGVMEKQEKTPLYKESSLVAGDGLSDGEISTDSAKEIDIKSDQLPEVQYDEVTQDQKVVEDQEVVPKKASAKPKGTASSKVSSKSRQKSNDKPAKDSTVQNLDEPGKAKRTTRSTKKQTEVQTDSETSVDSSKAVNAKTDNPAELQEKVAAKKASAKPKGTAGSKGNTKTGQKKSPSQKPTKAQSDIAENKAKRQPKKKE